MIPILEVGPPGIGKTARVLAQYDHVEVLLLSACTEEDIAGLPYREGDCERRTQPPFIERLRAGTGTKCLFLDELDKARREVADTLLSTIQDPQRFGIPPGTDIRAAANPPEWGGGDGISKAMLSRFSVVRAIPDVKAWAAWARTKYPDVAGVLRSVERVLAREIPLMESVGEEYDWRLTCPRTIERAWQAIIAGREDLVAGLLTPNAATGILACFTNMDAVQAAARSVGSRAQVSREATKKPLRVKP